MEALLSIRENKLLIICKLDKGNGIVLMNKTNYVQKMNAILSYSKRFILLKSDKNVKNLEKFQNCLNRLNRGKHLDEDIYECIQPFAAVTHTLYGLPKTRREACPCRPVLASYDCFNYKCATWLNEILNPLRQHPTNVKGTLSLLNEFRKAALNKI